MYEMKALDAPAAKYADSDPGLTNQAPALEGSSGRSAVPVDDAWQFVAEAQEALS